jgi:hypothetical protein
MATKAITATLTLTLDLPDPPATPGNVSKRDHAAAIRRVVDFITDGLKESGEDFAAWLLFDALADGPSADYDLAQEVFSETTATAEFTVRGAP